MMPIYVVKLPTGQIVGGLWSKNKQALTAWVKSAADGLSLRVEKWYVDHTADGGGTPTDKGLAQLGQTFEGERREDIDWGEVDE